MSTLISFEVNLRIKLAFLWTTSMVLYLYGDFFNLMSPNSIQKMMKLKTPLGSTNLKPEICNRNRDEGIKRKERGTYVDEA